MRAAGKGAPPSGGVGGGPEPETMRDFGWGTAGGPNMALTTCAATAASTNWSCLNCNTREGVVLGAVAGIGSAAMALVTSAAVKSVVATKDRMGSSDEPNRSNVGWLQGKERWRFQRPCRGLAGFWAFATHNCADYRRLVVGYI